MFFHSVHYRIFWTCQGKISSSIMFLFSMNNFKETFWHFLSHNTGFWLVKHNVTLASNKFALPKLTSSTFQSFPYENSEKGIRKFCKMPNNWIISGVTRHFSSRSTIQTIVCYEVGIELRLELRSFKKYCKFNGWWAESTSIFFIHQFDNSILKQLLFVRYQFSSKLCFSAKRLAHSVVS